MSPVKQAKAVDIPKCPGLYAIRNGVTNGYYIGSAKNLRARWHSHASNLRSGNHHNPKLQASWNKHGEAAFAFEVLEVVEDAERLTEREQKMMDSLGIRSDPACYNLRYLAESNRSYKHTEESRRRMSEAQRAAGRSEKQISTAAANIRAYNRAQTGKPKSEAHRNKISASTKGRKSVGLPRGVHPNTKLSPEAVAEIFAADPRTMKEYEAYAEHYGVSKHTVSSAIRQKRRVGADQT